MMEATTVSGEQDETPAMVLRPSSLLFVYIIIPIVALFLCFDGIFFGFALGRSFPADPHSIQWFTMFFMLPHIFSSCFTFLDSGHASHYRRRLMISVPVLVLFIAVVFAFRLFVPFMLFISVYTIYHLVGQQTGIASMLARNRSGLHVAWKWLTFLTLAVTYMAAITGVAGVTQLLTLAFPWFSISYLAFSFLVARQAREKTGRYYIAAYSVMIVFCFYLYVEGLPFFMILIPRFVHDVTAYFFYVAHNTNRNAGQVHNVVSRLGARLSLPEYVYTPLTGIVCTAAVTLLLGRYIVFLIAFMALFHYYWEGIMWKHGSPHRRYIHFAAAG